MLHPGVERDHREVVRVGDRVDVAGEAERERGERHDLGESAAGGRALDVEGRAAGRLADAADHLLAEAAESLDEAERRRRLAFAERSRRNGGDVDVFALASGADALEDFGDVNLREELAVGVPFAVLEAKLRREVGGGPEGRLRRFRDLPVLQLRRVEFHRVLSLLSRFRFSCVLFSCVLYHKRVMRHS